MTTEASAAVDSGEAVAVDVATEVLAEVAAGDAAGDVVEATGDLSRLGEEWWVLERNGVAVPARLAGTRVGVGFENTGMVCLIASRIASA